MYLTNPEAPWKAMRLTDASNSEFFSTEQQPLRLELTEEEKIATILNGKAFSSLSLEGEK